MKQLNARFFRCWIRIDFYYAVLALAKSLGWAHNQIISRIPTIIAGAPAFHCATKRSSTDTTAVLSQQISVVGTSFTQLKPSHVNFKSGSSNFDLRSNLTSLVRIQFSQGDHSPAIYSQFCGLHGDTSFFWWKYILVFSRERKGNWNEKKRIHFSHSPIDNGFWPLQRLSSSKQKMFLTRVPLCVE